MKLKKSVLERVKSDQYLKSEIVRVTGKSYATVLRWLANNDEMLTLFCILSLIRDRYALSFDEICENK